MKTFCLLLYHRTTLLSICLVLAFNAASGQKADDTARRIPVEIVRANLLQALETDSGSFNKLIGDVALKQGDSYMYCDSAYLNLKNNSLEAFGEVYIEQPGSRGASNYLRYQGNTRLAYMRGDVNLTDNKDNLWSEEVYYDMSTRVGTYNNGGTLQNGETIVTSNSGTYNMRTKDARFIGNVVVTDPQYHITSEDMGYNTETKVTLFSSPSVVTSDSSVLNTSCGTYDTKNKVALFTCRSSIINKEQYLEADTIHYNKLTGVGHAYGHVIAIDTAQKTTLYSGRADYNELENTMLATIKPVLKQMNGKDSLFIRADTLFSAPVPVKADTNKIAGAVSKSDTTGIKPGKLPNKRTAGKKADTRDSITIPPPVKATLPDSSDIRTGNRDTIAVLLSAATDTAALGNINQVQEESNARLRPIPPKTAAADTSKRRYFIAYHHVLIYSDSLQGRCDSLSYSQEDSVMKMMYDPVLWSRRSQITGDTILLYMDSGKMDRMYIPNNALVVSQSGPDKAKLFDQIQGKTLTGYFEDNTITQTLVYPAAETIYYSKDERDAYLGVNEASSERMRIFFEEQKIHHIIFEQDVKQKMTPLQQADLSNLKLSRFNWIPEKRPRNLQQLFE